MVKESAKCLVGGDEGTIRGDMTLGADESKQVGSPIDSKGFLINPIQLLIRHPPREGDE